MLAYVLRRLLQSLLVLLGVSVIVFGLLHLTGDPTRLLLPLEAREEDVRQLRALLGLDDPLAVQYVRFLSRAVRGDFGLSFKHQIPALTLILQTLPATLELTAAGLGLALAVAVPAGPRTPTTLPPARVRPAFEIASFPPMWSPCTCVLMT